MLNCRDLMSSNRNNHIASGYISLIYVLPYITSMKDKNYMYIYAYECVYMI